MFFSVAVSFEQSHPLCSLQPSMINAKQHTFLNEELLSHFIISINYVHFKKHNESAFNCYKSLKENYLNALDITGFGHIIFV